jgi:hypothetical protein
VRNAAIGNRIAEIAIDSGPWRANFPPHEKGAQFKPAVLGIGLGFVACGQDGFYSHPRGCIAASHRFGRLLGHLGKLPR